MEEAFIHELPLSPLLLLLFDGTPRVDVNSLYIYIDASPLGRNVCDVPFHLYIFLNVFKLFWLLLDR